MSPQLQQVLTEIDRLSSIEQIQIIEYINTKQRSSVLETITKLRPAKAAHSLSQQASFTTPEEIDAEILEEKATWTN
jgi:hypothetical protein